MQTISFLLFGLQESGLVSQDILSEKPWKRKKYAEIIFTSGEKGNICFLVLINRFRQFGAEKNFINSFSNFFKSCLGRSFNCVISKILNVFQTLVSET